MSTRRRITVRALGFLSAALCLSAIALWLIAIWTVGSNSGRFAGTGVLAIILSLILCVASLEVEATA